MLPLEYLTTDEMLTLYGLVSECRRRAKETIIVNDPDADLRGVFAAGVRSELYRDDDTDV